jgi:hypothetical protein
MLSTAHDDRNALSKIKRVYGRVWTLTVGREAPELRHGGGFTGVAALYANDVF